VELAVGSGEAVAVPVGVLGTLLGRAVAGIGVGGRVGDGRAGALPAAGVWPAPAAVERAATAGLAPQPATIFATTISASKAAGADLLRLLPHLWLGLA